MKPFEGLSVSMMCYHCLTQIFKVMVTYKALIRQDKENKAGLCPLVIRITKNRMHSYHFLGHRMESKFWDSKKCRVKSTHPNYKQINAKITNTINRLEFITLDLDRYGIGYRAKDLNERLKGHGRDNIITFIEQWIKERKETGKIGYSTYIKYNGVKDKLSDFCNGVLPIYEFNIQFIRRYEKHLRTFHKNKQNTISSNLSMLRAAARGLEKSKLLSIEKNPFREYEFKFVESSRSYLPELELDKLWQLNLAVGTKLNASLQIFLFCFQTGLRIGDALHLKVTDYQEPHIRYYSQKSKSYQALKLTTKARNIVSSFIPTSKNGYVFPFLNPDLQFSERKALNDQKSATALINKNLKIIAKRAELSFAPSTHIGRHSLATNALIKGLGYSEVKAILNHKDVKVTQIYAKVVDSFKDAAVDKLE